MENMQNTDTDVLPRGGLSVQDYLIEFLRFLKERTCGFCPKYFQTNDELNRTLLTLEYYKIPKNMWISFLNAAMRIIAQFMNTVNLTVELFIKILMDVLNSLVYFAIEYFFVRATLFIIGQLTTSWSQIIVRALYYFITWVGYRIWESVYPKIEQYSIFVIKKLKTKFEPQENNESTYN